MMKKEYASPRMLIVHTSAPDLLTLSTVDSADGMRVSWEIELFQ